MLEIKPKDFNKKFDKTKLVTNFEPVNTKTGKFNEDGIFSSRIFGNMSASTNSWSCDCGKLQAEFNKNMICKVCNTKVIYRGLTISREGWIDLHYDLIHPLLYRYISSLIGPTALMKILKYKNEINGNGTQVDPVIEAPYYGIGLTLFKEHFDKIINYYLSKKKDKESKYNFIMKNRDLVFIKHFSISNSKLRPAILIGNEFSFDEINIHYNAIIRNANQLAELTTLERIPLNVETILLKTQIEINNIYNKIIKLLTGKEGPIRGDLLGNRLDFTSRMVITPGDSSFKLDEVAIPYIVAVELFKPLILNKLVTLKKCSFIDANNIWKDSKTKFNKVIYSIMSDIIKSDNIGIVINRNPTIAVGSMLYLKIKEIKKDINDLTASISNLILTPLNGDYDGSPFLL